MGQLTKNSHILWTLFQGHINYSKVADWQPYVVNDGLLITGQNPASSEPAARELLEKLSRLAT